MKNYKIIFEKNGAKMEQVVNKFTAESVIKVMTKSGWTIWKTIGK